MKKIIFSLILFTIIISSCSEKPVEIPIFTPPETDKVVLIEELTGVECINCPDGAKVIRSIEQKYPGKVISIAIHAGELAHKLESSKYDLTCEDGDKLEGSWSYLGKPAAVINRVVFEEDGLPISGYGIWENYVAIELEKENVINLNLSTAFNEDNRELTLNIGIVPLKDLTGAFKLNVAITESHIIDAQALKGGSIDEEYEFDNVLRDMITSFDGDDIGSSFVKNSLVSKSFTYTVPESDGLWIPENLRVVAFVTDGEDGPFATVLNASESNIIE